MSEERSHAASHACSLPLFGESWRRRIKSRRLRLTRLSLADRGRNEIYRIISATRPIALRSINSRIAWA